VAGSNPDTGSSVQSLPGPHQRYAYWPARARSRPRTWDLTQTGFDPDGRRTERWGLAQVAQNRGSPSHRISVRAGRHVPRARTQAEADPSRIRGPLSDTARTGPTDPIGGDVPLPGAGPRTTLPRVAEAHERLLRTIEVLTDEGVRRPSLLPTWSVGHVLTHLARNADSHVRRVLAATRGEAVDQYPGGYAAREAEIQAGSGRLATQIIDDVRQTARAVDEAWKDAPQAAWLGRTRDVNGRERPLFELPSRRW